MVDINLESEAEGEENHEYQPTERIPERVQNREPVNALHLDYENMLIHAGLTWMSISSLILGLFLSPRHLYYL